MQTTNPFSGSLKIDSTPSRYRLIKLGKQMAHLPIDLKIPRIFYGVPFWEMPDLQDIDDGFQELVVA
ncbi:hypothetical protein NEIMUCOT_04902 [Neisseria mucosa ATCC 25996]|uniref:Uncharacterized protein n=1 Tax=Neisseria mucosa (strain ATCC 25996 / DSM 4631 / NCTC 10774 / M26) TaxID=546266 RepID=D2ZWA9_NEIM2|nr:hypothetical protein [Neisseria mucosa]EFC88523.1 hypothetical protein NEIMUCOT_04902 [Neisseria mucosa ATCC 25996]SUA38255.1 DNA helicase [Neisseria mucosa]